MADKLAVDQKGRIRLEDAGFDWKILGPDVQEVSYNQFTTTKDVGGALYREIIFVLLLIPISFSLAGGLRRMGL